MPPAGWLAAASFFLFQRLEGPKAPLHITERRCPEPRRAQAGGEARRGEAGQTRGAPWSWDVGWVEKRRRGSSTLPKLGERCTPGPAPRPPYSRLCPALPRSEFLRGCSCTQLQASKQALAAEQDGLVGLLACLLAWIAPKLGAAERCWAGGRAGGLESPPHLGPGRRGASSDRSGGRAGVEEAFRARAEPPGWGWGGAIRRRRGSSGGSKHPSQGSLGGGGLRVGRREGLGSPRASSESAARPSAPSSSNKFCISAINFTHQFHPSISPLPSPPISALPARARGGANS